MKLPSFSSKIKDLILYLTLRIEAAFNKRLVSLVNSRSITSREFIIIYAFIPYLSVSSINERVYLIKEMIEKSLIHLEVSATTHLSSLIEFSAFFRNFLTSNCFPLSVNKTFCLLSFLFLELSNGSSKSIWFAAGSLGFLGLR